jgi:hypothetical protein
VPGFRFQNKHRDNEELHRYGGFGVQRFRVKRLRGVGLKASGWKARRQESQKAEKKEGSSAFLKAETRVVSR